MDLERRMWQATYINSKVNIKDVAAWGIHFGIDIKKEKGLGEQDTTS